MDNPPFPVFTQNTLHEVRRIQSYLGFNHSDKHLEAVINRCSIKNLRDDVESGTVPTRLKDEEGKSVLYRKGTVYTSTINGIIK